MSPGTQPSSRRARARSIAASLLVGLLLLSTSLSAHWHSEGVAKDGCSICVAAHLTPLEPASAPGLAFRVVVAEEATTPDTGLLFRGFSPRHFGRGPPGTPLVRVIS